MLSLLLVEDDNALKNELNNFFLNFFDIVKTFENAEEALFWLESNRADVVISDICLPGMSGLEFLSRVRKKYLKKPLIAISAFPETDYLIQSIELQIYRFFIKPFDSQKLIEEMGTLVGLLKKNRFEDKAKLIILSENFTYDIESQELFNRDKICFAGKKEIALLDFLVKNRHQYLSDEAILKAIWGETVVSASTVRALIRRLRKTLEDPNIIKNIRGYGYRLFISSEKM